MRGISMVGCISDDSANRCCDHSSRRFCSCAAFLLGLLSANNIVYVFPKSTSLCSDIAASHSDRYLSSNRLSPYRL